MVRREEIRRALIVAGILAIGLLLAVDLLREDSLVRAWVSGLSGPGQTPLQQLIERITP